MKVILVSYYFAPANIIGAVRFTKLAKYLSKSNSVTSYCSIENKWLFLESNIGTDKILSKDIHVLDVVNISHSSFYKRFAKLVKIKINSTSASGNSQAAGFFENFISILYYFLKKNVMMVLSLLQDIDFVVRTYCCKRFKSDLITADVIVTTYGPYSPHLIGLCCKIFKRSKIRWVADFRDPIYQPTDPFIVSFVHKLIERLVCRFSDHIVCVSQGYLDSIVPKKYAFKSTVITNGYDQEDLSEATPCTNNNIAADGKLIISYTGTTYAGRRNLVPLISSIKRLVNKQLLENNNVEFHYAGPEASFVSSLFESLEMSSILVNHSLVSRTRALELNLASDITIVATWDDEGHRGVLPGKLYELMMFDAAILALVETNIGGSEIRQMLADIPKAFCFESNCEDAPNQLDEFVIGIYRSKLHAKNASACEHFSRFSYDNIANKYIELFNKLF